MDSDSQPAWQPAWQARTLLRAARVGTLATTNQGQPYAALVTPATAPDLSILLFLSSLSEHTRHLLGEPRCAVLITGAATDTNPQTAPRLTITGLAEQVDDPALKARWLARHPYATIYADFGDFALWRVRPMGGMYIGGFARATRLRAADLTPDPVAVRAIADAAADIMAHCNQDHPAALARIAAMPDPRMIGDQGAGDQDAGGAAREWRMIAIDVDGCDLTWGDGAAAYRVAFAAPVASPEGVRSELVRLARARTPMDRDPVDAGKWM